MDYEYVILLLSTIVAHSQTASIHKQTTPPSTKARCRLFMYWTDRFYAVSCFLLLYPQVPNCQCPLFPYQKGADLSYKEKINLVIDKSYYIWYNHRQYRKSLADRRANVLNLTMKNSYCSYEPQSISIRFSTAQMRQKGIAPLSCRIPGDGYVSV